MSIAGTRGPQIFPVLSIPQRQAALRFASGPAAQHHAGAVLYSPGDQAVPAFLILAGSLEVVRHDAFGHETLVTSHTAGQITGEVGQLAGRPALVECRAGPDGCSTAAFDAVHLRAMVIGSAEIGEIIMRAFILRRTAFIMEGVAGSVLVGRASNPPLVRLQGFLSRNGYPFTVLDPAVDADAGIIVERFTVHEGDLPIVICPDGTLLKRPTELEVGVALGITPALRDDQLFDVAVVGAGPAGLATAVYAASEGLSTIVLDSRAFGGQAGASARIENYLGFPTGISGVALTGRAFAQAQKFGAEIAIPLEVVRLDCGAGSVRRLVLQDGRAVQARTVVIASGARYRRPDIPNLAAFEGAGVAYWASPVEAKLCEGEEVALVGAGNSAGQAVVFLASKVKRLHLCFRGAALEASMSRYLVERIAALPNVEVHSRTEIVALDGEPEVVLSSATFRNRDTGRTVVTRLRHVFLFIGAEPNAGWLESCAIRQDPKGFILTGSANGIGPFGDGSLPLSMETSVQGVFAIGDVRSGSVKRVAAAVGEGAAVVAQLHATLAQVR